TKGDENTMFQFTCTFPGCGHTGSEITKAHCRLQHNMERDRVISLYGNFTKGRYNAKRLHQKTLSEIKCKTTKSNILDVAKLVTKNINAFDAAYVMTKGDLHKTTKIADKVKLYNDGNEEYRAILDRAKTIERVHGWQTTDWSAKDDKSIMLKVEQGLKNELSAYKTCESIAITMHKKPQDIYIRYKTLLKARNTSF
ncbi:MAG: hypothetical protein ACRCWQ_08295, partial [Bacilli bacterium]